jgi:SAM-dependent methyltransferase
MGNEYSYRTDESSFLEVLKGPSELGIAAVAYLQQQSSIPKPLSILDIGCGNGRDAFYFAEKLRCTVLGIDIAEEAIQSALHAARTAPKDNLDFQCRHFMDLTGVKYDIVHTASVYFFLRKRERAALRETIRRILNPNGLLFLSTLSVSDTEYYGKGTPVHGDCNSFLYEDSPGERVYLHFSTRDKLVEEFWFLEIKELYEHHEYDPQVKGPVNYIPWILIGENTVPLPEQK